MLSFQGEVDRLISEFWNDLPSRTAAPRRVIAPDT